MKKNLLRYIIFLICFSFSVQLNAFVPKLIQIDESIFVDDILCDGSYKNWQYYPFEFEAVGVKKIISINNLDQAPVLITTDLLKKKEFWVPSFFKVCISSFYNLKNEFISLNTLKDGILGRYALKFEIKYQKCAEKNYIVCTDHFFMLYKQTKDQRIRNLECNVADKNDIVCVQKEEDVDPSEIENFDDEEEDAESLINNVYSKKSTQSNSNCLSCFIFSWPDIFG